MSEPFLMAGGIFKKNIFGGENREEPAGLVGHRAFELRVRQILEEDYFSPDTHRYLDREEIEHADGTTDCPDLAVYIDENDECECVAEAKDRAVLRKADMEALERYRQRRCAQRAIMFVPKRCHIQSGALNVEQSLGIDIVRVD